MILNTRLRELVERHQETHLKPDGSKMSQVEIAVMANVNPTTLWRYMNNKTESYDRRVMGKLAKYLGLKSPNDLFFFDKEEVAE